MDLRVDGMRSHEEPRNVFVSDAHAAAEYGAESIDNYCEVRTFVALLKACIKNKDIKEASRLHSKFRKKEFLQRSPYVATTLVSFYAKCGMFAAAQEVLREIRVANIISWNALLSGYVENGEDDAAIKCFERLQDEVLSPTTVTYICIVKACGNKGDIDKGKQIHERVLHGCLLKDILLGTALIDMYAKCGAVAKAQQVLEETPVRDSVCWNALIAGYAQHENGNDALRCYQRMQREGLFPSVITFSCVLKACGNVKAIGKGKQIHSSIFKEGLLENNIILGNALVDMYAKCGELPNAQQVLEEIPVRNTISWNALISGYVKFSQGQKVLNCFEQMQHEGLPPDVVTFMCILKACSITKSLQKGKQVHESILKMGFAMKDMIILDTALVDMYAKCGMLTKAQQLLHEFPVRNIIAWNALISGYCQDGQHHQTLNCFQQMQTEGLFPDAVTFICVLKSCGCIDAIEKGTKIHHDVLNSGFLEKDIIIGNALVDMYVKCGILAKAHEVIEQLLVRNAISWSALISGYTEREHFHEALNFFEQMQIEGISPDAVTFICVLRACGSTGAITKGMDIHKEIKSQRLLCKDTMLHTALLDMYIRCGMIAEAHEILECLPFRDTVSWNALIAGYAQNGHANMALKCFDAMQLEGLPPDIITFLGVLSACSHSGKSQETQMMLIKMSQKYGLTPTIEHYTCMIVGFGCAGNFDSAISVFQVMPYSDDPGIWFALLGACRKWGNVKLGILVFDQVIQLDSSYSEAYILMTSIFAAAAMQEDAKNIEEMRLKYAAAS